MDEPGVDTKPSIKSCPYCSETIRAEAVVCRYCGRDLPVAEAPEVENPPTCPYCGRKVHPKAMVCGSCNRTLPAGQPVNVRRPPRPGLRRDNVAVIVILIGVLVLLAIIAPNVLSRLW